MSEWRKPMLAAAWLALACTPAKAQYAPGPYTPAQPPAQAPAAPYQSQPYSTAGQAYGQQPSVTYGAPSSYSTAPSFGSVSEGLRAGLEANRRRELSRVQAYQSALTDPVARKILTWAMVDMFGEQLGLAELERASRDLQGWPREDARRSALDRARTGGVPTPGAPVPYSALGPSGDVGSTRPSESYSTRVFSERRLRMNEALRNGDVSAAYLAISTHGLPQDANYAEAESFAGWLALNKLRNPTLARQHFTRLDAAVRSPVSKARAAYWLGRTAEAEGDQARARAHFEQGAQYNTTFYGQLSAQKAGHTHLQLRPDPTVTAADRQAMASNEVVQAMRLLSLAGERSLVRVFGLHLGDTVQNETQLAALMDNIKGLNEQELSMLAYRRGAQRGLILYERGYPLRTPPSVMGGAEPAFVLAITRQESQFDPRVRSSADARGMMQLLPGTARDTARKVGISYDEGLLWDADYNMRLGSAYLGQVSNRFNGSYIMAAAGYNAGPGRPAQWIGFCGDPRGAASDPLDFIECIPFTETRNYVMRVMENMQVYRARLADGRAPYTLAEDLKRGSYGYATGGGGYRAAGSGQ